MARAENTRAPTAPRTRLLANLVGTVERWFQFARGFGRGRCATAFCEISFESERSLPMVYAISKILKHSKKTILLLLATTAISLFISGCGGLPQDAKQALDEFMPRVLGDSNPYNIASAQKASNPGPNYQEIWCVVTNRPIGGGSHAGSHFLLKRMGLLWDVQAIGDTNQDKSSFLVNGCSNW